MKRIDAEEASAQTDYTARGLHKFKKHDYQGAIEDYTKAIQVNPKDWIAYNNRGNTYSSMLHKAHTNEEKFRLIELAAEDFKASLQIKTYKDGNQKALSSLKSLEKETSWLEKTMSNSNPEDGSDDSGLKEEDIEYLTELSNHMMSDDEDMRFQKFQEDNPNVTRALTDLLKETDSSSENEDAVIRLNKTMESVNKSNSHKAIPVDESAEYGLSFDNPILVSNVLNGYNYLSELRTLDGNPITYERQGAEINSNGAHIDKYEIYEKGEYITDLYINCYGSTNSKLVPRGFTHKTLGNNQAATLGIQNMMNDIVNSVIGSFEQDEITKETTSVESLNQLFCDYSKLSFEELLFRKCVIEPIYEYANMGLIDLTSDVVNVMKWRFALFLTKMMQFRLMEDSKLGILELIDQDFKRILNDYLLLLVANASDRERKALQEEQYVAAILVNLNEDIQHYWRSDDSSSIFEFLFPTVKSRETFNSKAYFDDFHVVIMSNINNAVGYCLNRHLNT